MESNHPRVLTINGGSSSIKFSLFEAGSSLRRILKGAIERIGLSESKLCVNDLERNHDFAQFVEVPDYLAAMDTLMNLISERIERATLKAVGHRIVHGGPKYCEPALISQDTIEELTRLQSFAPEHLLGEIQLIEEFHRSFAGLTQVACFDTAFHHDLPQVARLLPIPRRYEAQGVRRYGFHGLSYEYLMQELEQLAGTNAASGRVILAHLGNGASMTAVHHGRSIDTTMSFTPASGLMMSSRCGDVDPGLISFLERSEKINPARLDRMMNHESGLLGVSETSSDMCDLLARECEDVRASEAVAMFCYQVKKWIGAYTAVLGGLDTLVFAGGIGENSPAIRARVCEGLEFLGIELNEARNATQSKVISADTSPTTVRVIATDEEVVIARSVCDILGLGPSMKESKE